MESAYKRRWKTGGDALCGDSTKYCPGENVSLLVHADNGKPMRSKDLKSLFEKLHVMSSHSRPHTSNDNAFAESIFATMKSRVVYPELLVSGKTF